MVVEQRLILRRRPHGNSAIVLNRSTCTPAGQRAAFAEASLHDPSEKAMPAASRSRTRPTRLPAEAWRVVAIVAALALSFPSYALGDAYKHLIGYGDLLSDYSGYIPDGEGVTVAMVEADEDGHPENAPYKYFPDPTYPGLTNANIVAGNPALTPSNSTHSRGTAIHFFGTIWGVASGVQNAVIFETSDYLVNNLNLGDTTKAPVDPATFDYGNPLSDGYQVINNSWAGSLTNFNQNRDALRRIDYVVDHYDSIVIGGVFNLSQGPDQAILLGQSFNALAVGSHHGRHISGPTDFNFVTLSAGPQGPGRVKPEIVGPEITTSRNSAIVSAVATTLYQSAVDTTPERQFNTDPDAVRSEPMKAILMTGATKTGIDGVWDAAPTSQPLDLTYGAGLVNIRNSFLIQQAGQQDGATTTGGPALNNYGWDYGQVADSQSVYYTLEVPDYHTAANFSTTLAWNVEVKNTSSNPQTMFTPTHQFPLTDMNLDLNLYDASGTLLVAQSNSEIDNVEHLWLPELAAGTYTLEVVSQAGARDYGLAWRFDTAYSSTGDYNEDGMVDSRDYALWRETVGSSNDLRADGNQDGVVDIADLDYWLARFGAVIPGAQGASFTPAPLATAPEPATALLLALAGGALLLRRTPR